MRQIKALFSKWYVQLFLVLATTVMGYIGYSQYYRDLAAPPTPAAIRIQSFFSTLKLFTFGFDVDNSYYQAGKYPGGQKEWVLQMLQTARFFGLLLTGTTLFRVLGSHLAHLAEQFRFVFWDFRYDKVMLIGCSESNCRLYRSADKTGTGLLISPSGPIPENLEANGYPCVRARDIHAMLTDQIQKTIKSGNRNNTIIINTEDEELNLALSRTAIETINTFLSEDKAAIDSFAEAAKDIKNIKGLLRAGDRAGSRGPKDPEKITNDAAKYAKLIQRAKEKIRNQEDSDTILEKIEEIERNLNKKSSMEANPDQAAEISALRETTQALCAEADRLILKARIPAEKRITGILKRMRIMVFAERAYQAIYRDIQSESLCPIKCLNKYNLNAYNFVSRYPLTKFIPEHKRHAEILTGTGCVNPQTEFNMILIGFGNTNQEIYLTSFASNQFVQYEENEMPDLKKVRYHIFDRSRDLDEKNLNHDVFRYNEGFLNLIDTDLPDAPKEADYLPLPPNPAASSFYPLDINNNYFYNEIRRICKANPLSVNHIVIAFGEDLDNMDLAQRLTVKKKEWELDNLNIFVRIRNPENKKNIRLFADHDYIPFGDEDYSLETLFESEIEQMASRKSRQHTRTRLEESYPNLTKEDREIHSDYEWLTMDHTKRLSNYFNFIGMRLKLNLIGFDYEEHNGTEDQLARTVSLKEFAEKYGKGDPAKSLDEKKGLIYSYSGKDQREDFKKDIIRKNLAVQEHYRWNAFMIMNGFVPGTIEQIRKNRSKDYQKRYHTNITTMEGLFIYRELMAKFKNTNEAKEDVIRYDYQPMDGAWAHLHRIGYDVVRLDRGKKKAA